MQINTEVTANLSQINGAIDKVREVIGEVAAASQEHDEVIRQISPPWTRRTA